MSWREATLGELAARDGGVVQTGPFGSQLHQSDYRSEGIPVIMPKDIIDGQVSLESVARVSEETAQRLRRHKLKPRAIVVPRRGEVTKRALIRPEQEDWLCGTGCIKIELNGEEILPEFLYYFMEQGHVVQWLEQHAVGTTMLNLSTSIVAALPIRYPGTAVQSKISEILGTYDRSIENNRRRVALLEQTARLLYQEWFVRLRFPGHERTPFVKGAPEGWRMTTAFEVMGIMSGGTPKTTTPDFWEGNIPFYTPKDSVPECYVLETEKALTELGLRNCNSRLYPRDTVFITARGTVGNMNLAQRPMAMNQSCYALFGKNFPSQYFLFCALHESIQHFRQQAVGAVFDAIIVDTFKLIPFVVPDKQLVRSFDRAVGPIFRLVENLLLQNRRLRKARDLLLPRLMSGEIAI